MTEESVPLTTHIESLLLCYFVYRCFKKSDPANVSVIPEILVAALDQEASFTCVGFGIPLPSLAWIGIDLDSPLAPPKFEQSSYNVTNEQGHTFAMLELRILGTSINEEGSYRCDGSNNVPNLIEAQNFAVGTFLIEGKVLDITITEVV